MQETWHLPVKSDLNDPEQNLKATLESNQLELGIFLSYYFKKEGAVTEDVKLKGEIAFTERTKGKLILDFDLVHFNACLNIHHQKRDEMKLQFEFDFGFENLKLTGPYWPEREMDEI